MELSYSGRPTDQRKGLIHAAHLMVTVSSWSVKSNVRRQDRCACAASGLRICVDRLWGIRAGVRPGRRLLAWPNFPWTRWALTEPSSPAT